MVNFKISGMEEFTNLLVDFQKEIKEEFLDNISNKILLDARTLLRSGPIENSKAPNKNAFWKGDLTRISQVLRDSEDKRRVVFATPYAVATEYGRPPGRMPPPSALAEWAASKKIGDNPKQVGWAIAKKIEKEGMPPRPFLQPSVVKARGELLDIFRDAFETIKSQVGL